MSPSSMAVVLALVAAPLTPVGAVAEPSSTWTADLSTVDADDGNVIAEGGAVRLAGGQARAASARSPERYGMLTLAPHELGRQANRVRAELDATIPAGTDVAVDVSGRRANGEWTEWITATAAEPAVLTEPTTTVQVRLVLLGAPDGASPEVRSLELTANLTPKAPTPEGAPLSYRVFATREGLVGGTTANGHVIVERDHFVALPSRRGLSPQGSGQFTVQVCAANGRCEWAPVWDVGPWNTRDDYWNPGSIRQNWNDLPQGKPQSQAAYQDGYNGGLDQYGRKVRNPAGIDLADGTFWDGLQLTDNAWVTATYLWTGTGVFGTVDADLLNVRTGTTTSHAIAGLAANHAKVPVECQLTGQTVTGRQGTTDVWLRVGHGKYVSKAWVAGVPTVAKC